MKRALVALAIVLAVTLIAGVLSAGVACAHDPRFACSPRDANPVVISDPSKSWAFYGHLAPRGHDRYRVQASAALAVPVQLLVDQRDAANPARPVATIADERGRTLATIAVDPKHTFFEPFSRVSYVTSDERTIRFPAGATWIDVAMQGGESQRYTLAVGSEERFSPLEMPYLLGAVYRIHTRSF